MNVVDCPWRQILSIRFALGREQSKIDRTLRSIYIAQMHEIYLWRYQTGTRNYPGYHLSLNEEAAQLICEKLRSRLSMQMDRPLRLDLKKPGEQILSVPNNKRHRAQTKGRLEISINFDSAEEYLSIIETPHSIEANLSSHLAAELIESVEGLMSGENDYAMWGMDFEGKRDCIWFW